MAVAAAVEAAQSLLYVCEKGKVVEVAVVVAAALLTDRQQS